MCTSVMLFDDEIVSDPSEAPVDTSSEDEEDEFDKDDEDEDEEDLAGGDEDEE